MTKIDIITGFYGAGKTRFIKKILDDGIDKKTVAYLKCASVDGEFDSFSMEAFGIKGFEIKVCPNSNFYKETLSSAVRNVLELYEPRRIIIETAGNISTSKLIDAIEPLLVSKWIEINTVVAIVDAKRAISNIEKFPHIFREQVEQAQTVVLSCTEEVNKEELFACEVALRKFNTHATVLVTPWDEVESINLRNSIEVTSKLESIVRNISIKEKLPLVYENKKSIEKDLIKEQCELEGVILNTKKEFDEEQVKVMIDQVLKENKEVFRIKGNLFFTKKERFCVDYLQGKLLIWNEKGLGTGNVQIIGKELIEEKISKNIL